MKAKRREDNQANQRSSQTFLTHVDELRTRIFKSLICLVVLTAVSFLFVDSLLSFIIAPIGQVMFTSPADAFVARIMLAILAGVLLSLPVLIYQVWQFVSLGLKEKEIKYVALFMPFSILLFLIGGIFAYSVIIPYSLQFLLGYQSSEVVPMITINNYVSFIGTLIIAFGVIFELPLVMMFLTKIGIATPAFLSQKRKHAIVIIFIVSALITPPDFITQLIMSGPLIILYEIGVIVSKIVYRKKDVLKN